MCYSPRDIDVGPNRRQPPLCQRSWICCCRILASCSRQPSERSLLFRASSGPRFDRLNSIGQCGHGVRACLLPMMTMAGPNRVLRILVDQRKSDRDLMGSNPLHQEVIEAYCDEAGWIAHRSQWPNAPARRRFQGAPNGSPETSKLSGKFATPAWSELVCWQVHDKFPTTG